MSRKYYGIPAGYEDELNEFGDDGDDEYDSISRTAQNLKITIVPDITSGAGLNGEDFDCTLSEEMGTWFDAFRLMWNSYKKTPAAQQSLRVVYMKDSQPLLLALKLFANCPGCNNLKNKNLALFILETICELYKKQPNIAENCEDNTRMTAFNFVKSCGIVPLYKSVLETYELFKIRELLVPQLEQLIARHQYKDAAYWAMLLQVTHLFGLYEIVFPLILQDKVFLAEEYLQVAKAQQLPTVQFLDSLLDKQKTVLEHCEAVLAKYKYDDIKHNFLSYRPMSKLVTRLAKKYKIDANHTPNLNFSKACSYMHYLHRKYQDGGMSCESWRELIRDAANTRALQINLVANVATHGDMDEAMYWAHYFKVPPDECPYFMQSKMTENGHWNSAAATTACAPSPSADDSLEHCVDVKDVCNTPADSNTSKQLLKSQDYLELELPDECIVLVDNHEKFLQMIAYLELQTLIAFDSEWKPSVFTENIVSLLQLATFERVFLLDCLETNQLSDDLWRLLGRNIFNNMEILKLGFSLKQDLNLLNKSLPALQLNLQNSSCYLDLRDLWRRLKYMQIWPFIRVKNSGGSLCAMSEACLGKKLDKSNQCSNWANRPLRRDQIVYAALDAHCLLQIYQVLAKMLHRMGLDVEQVVDEVTTAKSGYLLNAQRTHAMANAQGAHTTLKTANEETMTGGGSGDGGKVVKRCNDFKLICDSMLLGLAKELRKLGIDCIEITNYDIQHYVTLAKVESRYVLTRDSRYALFCQELPMGQCIEIPIDSSVQQAINVMMILNIDVEEHSLFSRCIFCNCNEFIFLNNREMQQLIFGEVKGNVANNAAGYKNPFNKPMKLLQFHSDMLTTRKTYRGATFKCNHLSKTTRPEAYRLRSRECIYICDNCGACTYDGAHSLHSSILKHIASAASATERK